MKVARQFSELWALTMALAAVFAGGEPTAAETLLERGSYLVNAVMACDSCHTPRGPQGALVMEKRFSGGSQTWDEPTFLVKGANITPDQDTGIGTWSEHDLKRALIEGARPGHARLGGVPLVPQMPFNFYKILLPRDRVGLHGHFGVLDTRRADDLKAHPLDGGDDFGDAHPFKVFSLEGRCGKQKREALDEVHGPNLHEGGKNPNLSFWMKLV